MLTMWVSTDDTEILIGVDDEIMKEEVTTDDIFTFTLPSNFSGSRILAKGRCLVTVPRVSLAVFNQC